VERSVGDVWVNGRVGEGYHLYESPLRLKVNFLSDYTIRFTICCRCLQGRTLCRKNNVIALRLNVSQIPQRHMRERHHGDAPGYDDKMLVEKVAVRLQQRWWVYVLPCLAARDPKGAEHIQ
jgi:hypothetical protein